MFPYTYLTNNKGHTRESSETIIGDRSLGRNDALHETMMAAFRETNAKCLESAVEEFAKSPEIFDLFAWQQFLEIHHCNNPDPGFFAVELQLLFDATWTVLTQANPKTDEASKTLTENLKGVIQKYISDNNKFRPNLLLPELLTAVPMKKLQKLAATRIFRTHLDSYMRSGIVYIYYFEVFLYLIFTAIFTRLSIKFKFSIKATEEWDDVVIRDMTIACFVLALYFLLRELAQFHAMYQLNLQKNWFKDFWNYIDLVASGGTIVLLEYYFRMGPGPEYEHFASAIALFVWMKVLGFAKAFSQPIATFVLMLSTIFRDLFSFMAVLVIILVMFGHAFYLVLTVDEAIDEPGELDFTTTGGTAWSLYLMILGTFESSAFTGVWGQGLFICYSFLVVIILLNVLIAIVSDSYDAVLVTSTELQFSYSDTKLVFKELFTLLYGVDSRKGYSNKKNKHLLVARIVFSPLLIAFTICFLLLWWLPYSILTTILGDRSSSNEVKLDLKLDSSSSDWSGRVLDIVRRVNAITSSESAKTNSKITTLKASNAKLQQDLDNLTACMNRMMEKFEIDLPKKPSDAPPEPSKDSVEGNEIDKEGEVKDSAASTSLPPPPPGSGNGDGAVVNPLLVENEGGDVEMSTTKSSK
ncbi:hypothetical protein TrST_g4022 [Triparma strigata]|uniref:Ion transport domain-containing protein n=1 Tax=Triparma strigata TaxID=1606541 RepID=A0A9W7BWS5_9STRA|nr:hypothetical protein TrST_g4022 [Triparma strigata]